MLKYTSPEIKITRFRPVDILTGSEWLHEGGDTDDGKGGGTIIDGPDSIPLPTFSWGD
jgi:hypothetical protein